MYEVVQTNRVTCPNAHEIILIVWVCVDDPEGDIVLAVPYHIIQNYNRGNLWEFENARSGDIKYSFPDAETCITAAIEDARRPIAPNRDRGELISTKDVASRLGVSESRVRQFVMQGRLTPVKKSGRDSLFYENDLEPLAIRPTGRRRAES